MNTLVCLVISRRIFFQKRCIIFIHMKKVLIANRGEIAIRVMRTCKEMGIKTVAVYSDVDRNARFVHYADQAYPLGGSTAAESYLVQEKIIEACKTTGADAIHPGYGFLSENAVFRRKVEQAGITFIGPSPESMELMGSKLAAKDFALKHDIPMVPGIDYAIEDTDEAIKIAREIGFPILIKASAGGGGKGMRIVENAEELADQMARAISEAKNAFGDGSVFIEKFVTKPKHIEIQVLADMHGNAIHLFERDCSIQRRHQKVIEEAPSAVLSEELRQDMGACAVRIAKESGYVGVGTVEFLYEDGAYYFLEMNTRLQVEHPVTEMITGVDLVREQINVARGEVLSIKQEDLKINGHAVEIRVYAENVLGGFLPDTGVLSCYDVPKGPGVRIDDAYQQGEEIPVYYDPMIAKLVVFGKDRADAIHKTVRAIEDYNITGVHTTLRFCKHVIQTEAFKSGNFTTNYVKEEMPDLSIINEEIEEEAQVAAMALIDLMQKNGTVTKNNNDLGVPQESLWKKNRTQF